VIASWELFLAVSCLVVSREGFVCGDGGALLDDVNKNHRLYEAKFVNYVK